nr:GNAT family N-acetyltransferase [uncultured Aminipila sp.]
MIRKATQNDIEGIVKIYDAIIKKEEEHSLCVGWKRGVYPTEDTAEKALNKNELYVLEDNNHIVAAAIINQTQVLEYKNCNWTYQVQDDEIMVLHTLVVDPEKSNKGYGKKFVEFYEEFSAQSGIEYLRMDTNAKNLGARKFYKKIGYQEVGVVSCEFNGIEGVQLICLEKRLFHK